MEPDTPHTLPRYRRGYLASRVTLLTLVTFVWALLLVLKLAQPELALYVAAGAALLTGLVAGVWGWRQRVAFGPTTMTLRGLWRSREVAYDAIESAGLRWYDPHAAGRPDATVTVRARLREGAPVEVTASWRELAPMWVRMIEPLRARHHAALARGEVVTYRDETAAPWASALWAVGVSLFFAAAVAVNKGVVIVGVMLTQAIWSLYGELRNWRRARAAGGLELSAEGLREVGQRRDDDDREAYRQMRGPAQGWIPWSEVQWVMRDGRALRIGTRHRAEPLYVSPSSEVDTLHEILQEHIERHGAPIDALAPVSAAARALRAEAQRADEARTAAAARVEAPVATGVRIAVEAPAARDAESPHEVDAAAERAARGQRAAR